MMDSSGSTFWSYDERGRLVQESKTINGKASPFVTSWTYNRADLPDTMTYPEPGPTPEKLTYTYNDNGQLYSVASNLGDTYLTNTDYDASGRMTSIDYGDGLLRKTFDYFDWADPVKGGLLNSAAATRLADNATLQLFGYSYDANGNIQAMLDVKNSAQRTCLTYDALNRLTKATTYDDSAKGCTAQLGQGNYSETYTYNSTTGNLSSKAGIGYTYDSAHPHAVQSLSNGYSYVYDANGNMTYRDLGALEFDLVYDEENRLVSVTGNGSPPTATPPPSATPSATKTVTQTPTGVGPTATFTSTPTPSNTPTPGPTSTSTPTASTTPSGPTATPSVTETPTATASATPSQSQTPSGPTPTSTPTPTATQTSQASGGAVYVSLSSGDTLSGLSVDDLDIVYFDGANWSMFFDASDVGISEGGSDQDLNDFQIVDVDTILLTFNNAFTIGSITVDPGDIVQFDATSLGDTTTGTFSLYLDGNDVGLDDTVNEIIDALDLLSDGRVLISTMGSFSVPGLTGNDEDLLAFTPTTLGDTTSGTWAMYFDGSLTALGLGNSAEDVDALEIAASGDIYLSTGDVFAVTGISGEDEDIFVCTPAYTGNAVTSCTYSSTLFFDGSAYGLSANDVDAINLPLELALHSPLPVGEGPGVRAHFVNYNLAPPPQTTSTTFTPVADAYVDSANSTTNYGTSTTLRADNSPILKSYLRFDVQGLTGNVTSATLRIYANSASTLGYDVYAVTDNTWTETGITYDTTPVTGTKLGASGTFSAGWTSVDVTSYITGNGAYNFAFSTGSSTNISFSSREGANVPQLVIETSSGATATPMPGATTTPTASQTPGATSTHTPTATITPSPTRTPTAGPTPTTPPSFQSAAFVYDGDGKRVKSTFNGTITTYFVGNYYEVTGSTVTKYYYAGAQRIAMRTNGTLYYLLGDHLGSTSLTTNASGQVVSEMRYKAWGEVRYASGEMPTKYTFTGQYSHQSEFGLMFYNARWVDVSLGRFAQADSIVPEQSLRWIRLFRVEKGSE